MKGQKRNYREELALFAAVLKSGNPHGDNNSRVFSKLIFVACVAKSEKVQFGRFYNDIASLVGRGSLEWNRKIGGKWARNAWGASE